MGTRPSDEEVIARTRRWLERAVIGLNLCPFARAAYVRDRVRLVVSHARHIDALLGELDRELQFLVNTPADQLETTLIIHPTLFPDFLDFNDFMAVAEAAPADQDLEGVIQLASFHPQFQFDGTEPDDVSNCTNRSPYPTLHLLREDSVEKAVSTLEDPDVIFEENIRVLQKLGPQGWRDLDL
jgi:hypothetical protein